MINKTCVLNCGPKHHFTSLHVVVSACVTQIQYCYVDGIIDDVLSKREDPYAFRLGRLSTLFSFHVVVLVDVKRREGESEKYHK